MERAAVFVIPASFVSYHFFGRDQVSAGSGSHGVAPQSGTGTWVEFPKIPTLSPSQLRARRRWRIPMVKALAWRGEARRAWRPCRPSLRCRVRCFAREPREPTSTTYLPGARFVLYTSWQVARPLLASTATVAAAAWSVATAADAAPLLRADGVTAQAALALLAQAGALRIPQCLSAALPAAVLLAPLWALGAMAQQGEIVAARSLGVPPTQLLAGPVLLAAAAAAITAHVCHVAMPSCAARAQALSSSARGAVTGAHSATPFPGGGGYLFASRAMSGEKSGWHDVATVALPERSVVCAATLRQDGQSWTFTEGVSWSAKSGAKRFRVLRLDDSRVDEVIRKRLSRRALDDLLSSNRNTCTNTDATSTAELFAGALSARLQDDLRTSRHLCVKAHQRSSLPVAVFLLGVTSALLALVTDEVDGRRSGLAALCIAFTFWVVSALGSALAQLGMLPCWIGAWLGCAVLAGCAGFSLHNVLSK